MAEAIDDAAVNRRIYWHLDRALQRPVRRRCGEDLGRDERLADFGELMGTTVTENADVVEDNPAELDTYDRRSEPLNAVIHHPGQSRTNGSSTRTASSRTSSRRRPTWTRRSTASSTLRSST